jgi:hypothetical protein
MEQAQPENPSLSLSDLVLVLNLMRAAAERGAIRVEEMAETGAVYQRLVKFLEASGALQQAPAAPAEPSNDPAAAI